MALSRPAMGIRSVYRPHEYTTLGAGTGGPSTERLGRGIAVSTEITGACRPSADYYGTLSCSGSVNACVRIAAGRKVTTEHREFATTTAGLLELAAWLTEAGCTHVAMEATGVYWKPVWHVLEDEASFTLVLANAQHIRNVPGRKSDRNDAAWIADLLAHGLIRGSFVPPAPIQELRDLTRTRKQLVREIARHTQRLQKTLEDANVKFDARGHRHSGRQRPGDPRGAHRRGDRSRAVG